MPGAPDQAAELAGDPAPVLDEAAVPGPGGGTPQHQGPSLASGVAVGLAALAALVATLPAASLGRLDRSMATTVLQTVLYSWFALVAFAAAHRRTGWECWAWRLLGGSGAASVASLLLFLLAASVPGVAASSAVAINAAILGGYACSFAGVLLVARRQAVEQAWGFLVLDVAAIAGTLGLLLWVWVYEPLVAASGLGPAGNAMLVSIPVADATVLSAALLALGGPSRDRPAGYSILLWAQATLAVVDVGATALAFRPDALRDAGAWFAAGGEAFVLAILVVAADMVRRSPPWPDRPSTPRSLAVRLLPLAPLAIALAATLPWHVGTGRIGVPEAWVVVGLAFIVMARLALTMLRNIRLEAQLARSLDHRTTILRMVSHDMANPLQPLTLQLAVLRSGQATAERQARAWGIVDRSTAQMTALSQEVRDISLAEAGRLLRDVARHDVAALAREAAHAHEEQAAPGVRVRAEADRAVYADVDPGRLVQVLDNLLSNALKFTKAGEVVVGAAAGPGGEVHISVRDTGTGLSPQQRERLFGAFARVHDAGPAGLGLGLYLARSIVEAHHGHLQVESPGPGQGATFTVVLPAARSGPI